MSTELTLSELDERIAAKRENIRELVEQAAAYSGAGDEDLAADRIAEQEQELAELSTSAPPCCGNRRRGRADRPGAPPQIITRSSSAALGLRSPDSFLAPEDFVAVAVDDPQRDRLGRPSRDRRGDDRGGHVGSPDLDFPQDRSFSTASRSHELDPERLRTKHAWLRPWFWLVLPIEMGLPSLARLAVEHEEGVHFELSGEVEADATAGLERDRPRHMRPIVSDFVRARLVLPAARLVIGPIAEFADQRLGLGLYSFHSRAPARRPGDHVGPLMPLRQLVHKFASCATVAVVRRPKGRRQTGYRRIDRPGVGV